MSRAPTLYGKEPLYRPDRPRAAADPVGGVLCLDFLNTTTWQDGAAADQFGSGYANVLDWFASIGAIDDEAVRRLTIRARRESREAAAVRKRAIALRAALRDVTRALMGGEMPPEDAIATVNEEVRLARAQERLVPDGRALIWRSETGHALDGPLHEVVHSAVDLLTSDRAGKIRECAAPDCGRLFLDASRNASRRFCSATGCGSLVRVRRFRERRRGDPDSVTAHDFVQKPRE